MSELLHLAVPFSRDVAQSLKAGQKVLLSGVVYGARDQAHRRFAEALERGEGLPLDLSGQVIYYVGPTPAPPGRVCGAAGPTTSGRMDVYTPLLLSCGVRALIGKGNRSPEVVAALKEFGAVYLAAPGGAGALLSRCIKEMEVVAYPELGPEAVYRIVVDNFPVIVAIDAEGNNLYEFGPSSYRKKNSA
ncbi:MAG TPA: Fe-S-containing hydro-lyase [Peptococcaceae bacterium]|nr:Fe-S-containing hydro-lyase [Peptococcaceae bacterium]